MQLTYHVKLFAFFITVFALEKDLEDVGNLLGNFGGEKGENHDENSATRGY